MKPSQTDWSQCQTAVPGTFNLLLLMQLLKAQHSPQWRKHHLKAEGSLSAQPKFKYMYTVTGFMTVLPQGKGCSPAEPGPLSFSRLLLSPEHDSEQDPQHLKFTAGEDHLSKMIRGSEEISLTWLRWACTNALLRITFVGLDVIQYRIPKTSWFLNWTFSNPFEKVWNSFSDYNCNSEACSWQN